jgi:predicted nucleic acid-binding protein
MACALMLLYIAFGSKRKRRLVPALPPNKNESISFVHTIGNLYLQKKDNRNIAIKMMTYFFEHIRSSYYLTTSTVNADFIQALSRKSGVAENKVQQLMEKADYLNNTDAITDQELFEINNLIYEFYKR